MKKLVLFVLVVAGVSLADVPRQMPGSALVKNLNGTPVYLGTIVATTVKSNVTTAVPFTIAAGTNIALQCDVAADCANIAATDANATAAKMPLLAAGAFYMLGVTQATKGDVSCISVSGTATCEVYEVR